MDLINTDTASINDVQYYPKLSNLKVYNQLSIDKNLKPLVYLYLTIHNKTITLNKMIPVVKYGVATNSGKEVQTKYTSFISLNCDKQLIGKVDPYVSDTNVIVTDSLFKDDSPFNGITFTGSIIEGYIPSSVSMWSKYLKDQLTVAEFNNNSVLDIFSQLKTLFADGYKQNEDKINSLIESYNSLVFKLINKGFLVKSDLFCADQNSILPVIACYQNTVSEDSTYLNSHTIYGFNSAYAPDVSSVTGTGTINNNKQSINGFVYGQYSMSSTKDNIIIVPDNEKSKTLEVTVREINVDNFRLQISVADLGTITGIKKYSSEFESIPVGTEINFQGKIQFRASGNGTLATNIRVVNTIYSVKASLPTTVSDESLFLEQDVVFDDADGWELSEDELNSFYE